MCEANLRNQIGSCAPGRVGEQRTAASPAAGACHRLHGAGGGDTGPSLHSALSLGSVASSTLRPAGVGGAQRWPLGALARSLSVVGPGIPRSPGPLGYPVVPCAGTC